MTARLVIRRASLTAPVVGHTVLVRRLVLKHGQPENARRQWLPNHAAALPSEEPSGIAAGSVAVRLGDIGVAQHVEDADRPVDEGARGRVLNGYALDDGARQVAPAAYK